MGSYKCTFTDGSEALVHYGVLGMRWGVRHDKQYKTKKKAITDAYRKDLEKSNNLYKTERSKFGRSEADRRAEKRNDVAEAKRRSSINKAKVDTANRLYSTNSKEANRRIQTRSTAKTLGLSALMGSYGTMHYDRAKSEGKSTGKSVVRGILANTANTATYVVPGGGASMHNYLKDRAAREKGQRSGTKNRRYLD